MKILFVHQNFPGQFKHLAPALRDLGHEIKALAINKSPVPSGIDVIYYRPIRSTTQNIHPWVGDFETKVIRGEAVFHAALKMRDGGFFPDVIIAHPGWGETMFLKDVWPDSKLGLYAELYYQATGGDLFFDKEFSNHNVAEPCRLRIKNASHDLQFARADALISPTQFQKSTFPPELQQKISVVHDGIDTEILKPDLNAQFELGDSVCLTKNQEIITFVNRNLEPLRGYHIFMRALPEILKVRSNASIVIVGGDDVSYGRAAPSGASWKDIFLNEVQNELDMSRVHFVGKIPYPNFIKLLQVSTVHVYLSYPFVLSWSLLEAMSVGCAIVGSDTTPVAEVIKSNETGILVDFFDYKNLSSQILKLLADSAAREKFGRKARQHIIENFDLKKICLSKQLKWVEHLAN